MATLLAALFGLLWAGCSPGVAGESGSLEELAEVAKERRLTAAFLVVDGVYNTELTAPYDVLEHTLHHAGDGLGIQVFTVSPDGQVVTSAEGLRILPDYGFETAPTADILVVPSARGSRDEDLADRSMIEWVREVGSEAGAVVSLCWGAFVLAEAGLLDEHACTTFPSDYDTFATRFPDLDLRINVSFVHSGRAVTSQGGARSFDAAMFLVDRIYGSDIARRIGAGLLVPWPPEEGSISYLSSAR